MLQDWRISQIFIVIFCRVRIKSLDIYRKILQNPNKFIFNCFELHEASASAENNAFKVLKDFTIE